MNFRSKELSLKNEYQEYISSIYRMYACLMLKLSFKVIFEEWNWLMTRCQMSTLLDQG